MKKLAVALLCAVMLLGTISFGYAQRGDWRGGIRVRIHDARASIERGIDHGTLTRHEARKLRGELDRILDRIDRMRSDGDLSPRERDRIHRDLNRLERHIRREKSDFDGWRSGIRDRIHQARIRIERGIDHGTLTRHEARKLRGELDRILDRIDRMRSDGGLSPRERDRIHRDLDRLERHIRREKRDYDRR